MPIDMDQFRNSLEKSFDENRITFNGLYANDVRRLLALSPVEVDSMTPDTTDIETYRKLITVVETASRMNLDQAKLVSHIKTMGDVAVRIAKLAGIIV